jgi:hypothetical protein
MISTASRHALHGPTPRPKNRSGATAAAEGDKKGSDTRSIVITLFDAEAIPIVFAAALACITHRFIGLPTSIGLKIMSAVASLLVVALDHLPSGPSVTDERGICSDYRSL